MGELIVYKRLRCLSVICLLSIGSLPSIFSISFQKLSALCFLWTGVLEQSYGVEYWSGVKFWSGKNSYNTVLYGVV